MSDHAGVVRVARHYPAQGRHDEVAGLLKAEAEDMRDAPSCFGAQVVSSDRDQEQLVLISRWESYEVMEHFHSRPEFTGLQREMQPILEGPPEIEIFTTA